MQSMVSQRLKKQKIRSVWVPVLPHFLSSMPLWDFVEFFSQHVVKGSRGWFSGTRKEGSLFRLTLSLYLVLSLPQKWSFWYLSVLEPAVFLAGGLGHLKNSYVSQLFWILVLLLLYYTGFGYTGIILGVSGHYPERYWRSSLQDIFKGLYCAHRGVIHISFYKDVQTQVSPSAWGNFPGSLRSENCHHCPAGDSWCAWEGPFVLRGTEREQHGHVSTEGNAAKCPLEMAPARINRTVRLSKTPINNCWHLAEHQSSIWEIPLDDRVDERSSDIKPIKHS